MDSPLLPVSHTARAVLTLTIAAFFACSPDKPLPLEPQRSVAAEFGIAPPPEGVYNRYIVLFRNDVQNPVELAQQLVAEHGGYPFHFYQKAVKGFAVANISPDVVEILRANPLVRMVEPDGLAQQTDDQSLPLDGGSFQYSSLWSLDRIDERQATFDGVFRYTSGTGTHIYILDTGIRCGHDEFAGRIGNGTTQLSFSSGASPCIDQDGHGTEVASVAAGSTYGIAKGATIHPVRINDNDEAYYSDMIAGLDWVANNAIHPAVANLSYGGVPFDFGVRDAMEGVVNSGVVMVKSAGNSDYDAYQDRGNRANGAIIVSATDRFGRRALFSSGYASYGPTVTLWAPGYEIRAAGNNSSTDVTTVYGTSFSAPYTAGVAASFLQTEPSATAFRVRDVVRESATQDVLTNLGSGSPNRLLYSQFHSAIISGPANIVSDVEYTYSWQAITSGATSWTYQWEISTNGGGYSLVSNSSSYSRTIEPGENYSFILRLTAVGDGDPVVNQMAGTVVPPSQPCEPIPPAIICEN
jgi:subtilisin family serine protease